MGSKTKTKHEYSQLPITQQQQQLQSMVQQPKDSSLEYNFAKRREDINNSYMNPLGAHTTSAVRDASSRVANERMSMDEAQAVSAEQAQNSQAAFNRQGVVAGMTAPVNTSTTQSTPFNWGSLLTSVIGAGAQVGSAALTGGASAM